MSISNGFVIINTTMSRLILISLSLLILSGCSLPGKSTRSAISVESDLNATIHLNDNHVGSAPLYLDDIRPGEYELKISPIDDPSRSWQQRITLKPQLLTAINQKFDSSNDRSSFTILSLDKTTSAMPSLSVISLPDSARVFINQEPLGFAPIQTTQLPAGEHQITISSPGYKSIDTSINLSPNHRLTLFVQLGKDKDLPASPPPQTATASATLSQDNAATTSTSPKPPYVTINATETGWLRVRSGPTGYQDNEVARVTAGSIYPFKQSNNTGWYEIEYAPGQTGWISAQYATLTSE